MYFEGISACVSLTTKHVYCVTPCQLNRLLLFLVTIDIKTSKESASRRSASSTPSRSWSTGNVKSWGRGRRQSAKPEQPAELRGDKQNKFKLISTSPRRHVSTRPGRHQRAQVTGALTSMLPLAISRSTEII